MALAQKPIPVAPLVQIKGLKKYFPVPAGLFRRSTSFVHAVDDVSFDIGVGEVFGLVGESGCGKTTTGRLLVRTLNPTEGGILVEGTDIAGIEGAELKAFRKRSQMIFQDPYESLNPRMTIFDIVSEPLAVHGLGSVSEREERVSAMLVRVGLTPPTTYLFRFPHELSGGQRQRVAVARALVLEPKFIVADEPTSMLDVSIRTGVMQLLMELRENMNVSYLYITHDLAVARYLCDRIAVMYLGKIVESGETEAVIQNPLHPYTKALISAVPIPDPAYKRERVEIKGGVLRPIDPPPRCRFFERCPNADGECQEKDHPPLAGREPGHYVACYKV